MAGANIHRMSTELANHESCLAPLPWSLALGPWFRTKSQRLITTKTMGRTYDDIPMAHAQPIPPPTATTSSLPSQAPPLGEDKVKQLQAQGYSKGLIEALQKNSLTFPLRIWVVDNSGSMNAHDGNRMVNSSRKDSVRVVPCTRWKELQGTIEYHAQMAALLQAPTIFRMLNDPGAAAGPQLFGVADKGPAMIHSDLSTALSVIDTARPSGVTPLMQHVLSIRSKVAEMAPALTQRGQRVAVILATDGLPTDERGIHGHGQKAQFIDAMRSLEGLPVWVVIRLCTDDKAVVKFYNDLDEQLELSLEVLDDFISEGTEVHAVNPWITYGLPLHRMREMGFHDRLFDLVEERTLTRDEVQEFCALIFGRVKMGKVGDASADFKSFALEINKIAESETKQWSPAKKKVMPWIDAKALKKQYSKSCTIM